MSGIQKYFAFIVVAFSVIALLYPPLFSWLSPYIPYLLGVVMLAMGLTIKLRDFSIVFKRPLPMLIGGIGQFLIMPLIAFGIAVLFQLPPELAAGLILVGACPGGTSSNVMVYLARGDVALSVAMTTVSTVIAPIMTPLMILLLANQWMPIDASSMLLSIVQVIIVPVSLGILINYFFPKVASLGRTALPNISIFAIVLIVSAIVAVNQENLITVGLLLFVAVILHNGLGLFVGYIVAKWCGLNEEQRRTISFEVGIQNSGLGGTLATLHFSPLAALPSAIFSVWQIISGPILVSFWNRGKKGRGRLSSKKRIV
ncbi:bile acid:sodium symporter family protein [Geomicrobium sp. JCM 19038]|uniref:bile acid:sodium symporter family protein n=1 Tax=Geomicrobium sp. JCM 19038 TaxID=1460635 RepID=UPI00045F3D4D|nr:bile acid:sodium symporter family protein [Geomicrobium sp. JCM 19038]GAK08034.1 sodium-dependent transporter [Geomicrobium sp. JCM 19038]